MSKTKAYICDFKKHLVPEESAFGIKPIEDLIDKMLSFPVVNNPAKADIHICTECWNEQVLRTAAVLVDRRIEGESVYKLKVKELAYGFRRAVVFKYNESKRFKNKS